MPSALQTSPPIVNTGVPGIAGGRKDEKKHDEQVDFCKSAACVPMDNSGKHHEKQGTQQAEAECQKSLTQRDYHRKHQGKSAPVIADHAEECINGICEFEMNEFAQGW